MYRFAQSAQYLWISFSHSPSWKCCYVCVQFLFRCNSPFPRGLPPLPHASCLVPHLGREEFNRVISLNQLRARNLMVRLYDGVHRNAVIVCTFPQFCCQVPGNENECNVDGKGPDSLSQGPWFTIQDIFLLIFTNHPISIAKIVYSKELCGNMITNCLYVWN